MNIKVRQIKQHSQAKPGFDVVAEATIEFCDLGIAIERVALTFSHTKGFGVLPPIDGRTQARVVHWRHDAPVRGEILDAIKRAYVALGGELPAEPVAEPVSVPMQPLSKSTLTSPKWD